MSKQRLIITSMFSIVLITILMIGSTYSIFTTTEVDESSNIYTTGNLDVTYTLSNSNVVLNNITPMTEEQANGINPYRITITNKGTVPYMFNLILSDTTSSKENTIDYKYIMTKVGYLEPKSLNNCTNNIIKKDVILPAGSSIDIDVRVWLDSTLANSEMNKSFYAKLAVDGLAIYNDNEEINNNILSLRYMKTSSINDFRNNAYLTYIKNVSFINNIDTSNAITYWDMSIYGDNSVIAWITKNEIEGYYDLYIGSNEKIYAPSLENFFLGMTSLEKVSFDNLDTSLTTTMYSTFNNCHNLTTLDFSELNTNNLTNISYMFNNCSSLKNLNLETLNTSKVISMEGLFSNCPNLNTTITIMNNNINNYNNMFYNTANVKDKNDNYIGQITINYTHETKDLVDKILETKLDESNVVKGILVE